jgi:hypothetical protein
MNKLSWNDANTLPINKGDDKFTQFTALVLREIRKLGNTEYIDPDELWDFIHYNYSEREYDVETIFDTIFTTPQKEAKDIAVAYKEHILDLQREDETNFE